MHFVQPRDSFQLLVSLCNRIQVVRVMDNVVSEDFADDGSRVSPILETTTCTCATKLLDDYSKRDTIRN